MSSFTASAFNPTAPLVAMSFFNASQTVGPQTLANGHTYLSEKIAPQQEEKDLQGPCVVLGFRGARVINLALNIVQIIQSVNISKVHAWDG